MSRLIEEFPEELRFTVERLVRKGFIESVDGRINITDDMARLLVILDRADLFDWTMSKEVVIYLYSYDGG